MLPLRTLPLAFGHVMVNPCFITSDLFAAESCRLLHDNGPSVRNKRLSACAYAPLSVP